jgi:molybdenum cofactor cytidylyltransferase
MTCLEPSVLGLLLAAGMSRRFGSDKLAAPLPGSATTVLLASAQCLIDACPRSVAVVRAGSAHGARLRGLGFDLVELAPELEPGLGLSIAAGAQRLRQLGAGGDVTSVNSVGSLGCVLLLADLPFVQTHTISKVRDAIAAGASIAVARHQGQRGHPVGFAARHLPALARLQGDEGARSVLTQHADSIVWCDVDDAGALRDVDKPEDLAR